MRFSLLIAGACLGLFASDANAQGKYAKVTFDHLVPDAIKPTGAHGTVVLEGDIGSEGAITNLVVTKSSRSDAIDQLILTRYARARVAEDLRQAGENRIELTVKVYNTAGLDFGRRYTCRQVVLDSDWYKQTFETDTIERSPLYLLIQSSGTILGNSQFGFATNSERYDRVWTSAIAACRTAPDATFMSVIAEQGRRTQ